MHQRLQVEKSGCTKGITEVASLWDLYAQGGGVWQMELCSYFDGLVFLLLGAMSSLTPPHTAAPPT